jgi:HD-like signal output (HDOD) protein
MSVAAAIEKAPDVDAVVKGIAIPPRPALLADLQQEMARDDPDFDNIVRIVGMDVAMTAAVLRSVNSPYYGLNRRAETLSQAIALIGLRQISALVTGLVLRQVLRADGPNLTRFWDVSGKRAYALVLLARNRRTVEVDVAQSFGLFCDVGIPLLMQRFADYPTTLKRANEAPELSFTEVEQAAHDTDHALIGALMARTWGLSPTVCQAIRAHHEGSIFQDPKAPAEVVQLVAMSLLAEGAIQRFAGLDPSAECVRGCEHASGALMLGGSEVEDWIDQLFEGFAAGCA